MKTLRFFASLGLLLAVLLGMAQPARAQEELPLGLTRDFGYASGAGDIQGTFSMRVEDGGDLVKVAFLIDGETVFVDDETPFRYQFSTDTYKPGMHTLSAIGYTQDGRVIRSRLIQRKFVTADEAVQAALSIILPLLGGILGLMALAYLAPALLQRGKTTPPGAPRRYGLTGGAICKRCGRPFALHFFAPNLVVGKFDRCPHCGKWGLHQRQPLSALRAAEQMELLQSASAQQGEIGASPEEQLRKALDESRYEDL